MQFPLELQTVGELEDVPLHTGYWQSLPENELLQLHVFGAIQVPS